MFDIDASYCAGCCEHVALCNLDGYDIVSTIPTCVGKVFFGIVNEHR